MQSLGPTLASATPLDATRLRRAIRAGRFRGRTALLCPPDALAVYQVLAISSGDLNDLPSAVPRHFSRELDVPPAAYHAIPLVTPTPGAAEKGFVEVIAVGWPRPIVEALAAAIRGSGLRISEVVCWSACVLECLAPGPPADRLTVIGVRRSGATCFRTQDGRIRLVRNVRDTDAATAPTEILHEARAMSRHADSAGSPNGDAEKVIVIAAETATNPAAEALRACSRAGVEWIDPPLRDAARALLADAPQQQCGEWLACAGMILRSMGCAPESPAAAPGPKHSRARSSRIRRGVAASAAICAAVGWLVAARVHMGTLETAIAHSREQLAAARADNEHHASNLALAASMRRDLEALLRLRQPNRPTGVLDLVASSLPRGATLDALTVQFREDGPLNLATAAIECEGDFGDESAAHALSASLLKNPCLRRVRLTERATRAGGAASTSFALSFDLPLERWAAAGGELP